MAESTTNDDATPGVTGTLTSRSIRSFVIRNGRLTDAQQLALETLLPEFGIPFNHQHIDLESVFGRSAPTWQVNFFGIEVHAPGVGHALQGIKSRELNNVRVIQHDAVEVLQHMFEPASLARVLLFFPDPWHKKRHHKRRIVQDDFVNLICSRLQPNGDPRLRGATGVAHKHPL